RAFAAVELAPHCGRSLLLGGNGAGKTSLLEAIYLLAYGRSFRGGTHEALIAKGADQFTVFSQWLVDAVPLRLGLSRSSRQWQARIDGEPAETLGSLHRACAVVCFEPGSHSLLEGGGELRRRLVDWGLFHVEPAFLAIWRRYQRALRQRNALLKQAPAVAALLPWEQELADSGQQLDRFRASYLDRLAPRFGAVARLFLDELGPASLPYLRGWPEGLSLQQALEQARSRDLRLGFSSTGPHRADWRPRYAALDGVNVLSRGQEKLTALALLLAQAEDLAEQRNDWPVLLLDDLGSELDRAHQALVWKRSEEHTSEL